MNTPASDDQRRGPRGHGEDTRQAIVRAARRQFGELGYPKTTLRSIAEEAGVHSRLVSHYFGTKQRLFVQVAELPVVPSELFDQLVCPPWEGLGQRMATLVVGLLDRPDMRNVMVGMLRAAASEEDAASLVREFMLERVRNPLAERLPAEPRRLRATLFLTQSAGLIMARHILQVAELETLSKEQLVTAVAPVAQHYLLGDWPQQSQA